MTSTSGGKTGGGVDALTLVLADDHELVRGGLRLIFENEPGFTVLAEAGSGDDAVAAGRRWRPDVVVMDIEMPGLDGIEATRLLTSDDISVLILTTFERDDYILGAIRAGARGFLLKTAPPQNLIAAVRATAAGDTPLSPSVTRRILRQLAAEAPPPVTAPSEQLSVLTARELDVLKLVAAGLTNAEIAAHLILGETTVKTHVSRVLTKLQVRDRVQAVVLAYELGLVRPSGRRPTE